MRFIESRIKHYALRRGITDIVIKFPNETFHNHTTRQSHIQRAFNVSPSPETSQEGKDICIETHVTWTMFVASTTAKVYDPQEHHERGKAEERSTAEETGKETQRSEEDDYHELRPGKRGPAGLQARHGAKLVNHPGIAVAVDQAPVKIKHDEGVHGRGAGIAAGRADTTDAIAGTTAGIAHDGLTTPTRGTLIACLFGHTTDCLLFLCPPVNVITRSPLARRPSSVALSPPQRSCNVPDKLRTETLDRHE